MVGLSDTDQALCQLENRDPGNSWLICERPFQCNWDHGAELRITMNSLTVPTGMMSDVSLVRLSDCILRSSSSSLKR